MPKPLKKISLIKGKRQRGKTARQRGRSVVEPKWAEQVIFELRSDHLANNDEADRFLEYMNHLKATRSLSEKLRSWVIEGWRKEVAKTEQEK